MMNLEKEFSAAEHRSLGDIDLPGLDVGFSRFTFAGGAKLTFGEIILLAGDYFGVNLLPISLGPGETEQKRRFLAAYSMLDNCPPDKIYKITNAVSDDDVSNGISLQDIDGGYILLAVHNIDHFNDYAVVAFQAGYELAMQAALLAAEQKTDEEKKKQLQHAYMLLGYACHFLTDRFASGHMRTPRLELDRMFSPEVGSILSFFQHNEDGDMGLEVESGNIDGSGKSRWKAYGDEHLFEERNIECMRRTKAAVQAAVDEIYEAYLTKVPVPAEKSVVMSLIPTVTENNHPAMFKMNNEGNILCRVPLSGAPTDSYVELTYARVIEIMLYNAGKYMSEYLSDKVNDLIGLVRNQEKKIPSDARPLVAYSLFATKNQQPDRITEHAEVNSKTLQNQ